MTGLLIEHATAVDARGERDDAWVATDEDRILATGTGAAPAALRSGLAAVDAAGAMLTPGLVDLHCHGGGGAEFGAGPDADRRALAAHRRHGTTRTVVSLVSAPLPVLADRLRAVAALRRADPLVLGAHLEGPFLAPERRGAHDPAALALPTDAAVAALLEAGAADGSQVLRQVTIAPELPGADRAAARFLEAGVRVAVGHTTADHDRALAAFAAGASLLTHAFNAMPGIGHRAPGPLPAALEAPGTTLELVLDGVHVHPAVARMLLAAAPGRVALVTDAMAAAGAGDGDYRLGGLAVAVQGGVARLVDGGGIAGSTLLLDAAVRRAMDLGLDARAAVAAATRVPAAALGEAALGLLEPGFAADLVLWDAALQPVRTWGAGRELTA